MLYGNIAAFDQLALSRQAAGGAANTQNVFRPQKRAPADPSSMR